MIPTAQEAIPGALRTAQVRRPVASHARAREAAPHLRGELTSGALLQMGVAARRLRCVFAVRLVLLAVIAGTAGAADAARAQAADLAHLTVWEAGGSPVFGAAMQAVVIAVLAFGLSALTRTWIVIAVASLRRDRVAP